MQNVLNTYNYMHMFSVEVNSSVRHRVDVFFFEDPYALCAASPALSGVELPNLGERSARVWVQVFGTEGVKSEPYRAAWNNTIID